MFILKKGHQPGVYVPLRALFLVRNAFNEYSQCIFIPPLPQHLCRGVYSFHLSIRPFVCLFVRSFVRTHFRHICRICVKVLCQSFSSGIYLSNYLPESIHIWTIVTLEG